MRKADRLGSLGSTSVHSPGGMLRPNMRSDSVAHVHPDSEWASGAGHGGRGKNVTKGTLSASSSCITESCFLTKTEPCLSCSQSSIQ